MLLDGPQNPLTKPAEAVLPQVKQSQPPAGEGGGVPPHTHRDDGQLVGQFAIHQASLIP